MIGIETEDELFELAVRQYENRLQRHLVLALCGIREWATVVTMYYMNLCRILKGSVAKNFISQATVSLVHSASLR